MSGIEGSPMVEKKYPSPPPAIAISPIAIHSSQYTAGCVLTWLFGGSAFLCRFFICGFFFRRFGFGLRGVQGLRGFPEGVSSAGDWLQGRARGEFRLLRARKSRSRRMAARALSSGRGCFLRPVPRTGSLVAGSSCGSSAWSSSAGSMPSASSGKFHRFEHGEWFCSPPRLRHCRV